MGCCLGVPAHNDHEDSTDSLCLCLNCCVQSIKNKYASIFGRGRGVAVPLSNHTPASSDSIVEHSSSTASGIPVSNNAIPVCSRVPPDVTTRWQDKGSGHSRVEPEPLRDADVHVMPKLAIEAKLTDASSGKVFKEYDSECSTRFFSSEMEFVHSHLHPDSEDEDVCPTCLEEYTSENPKIVTKCTHHYHLSCIYEWKERSESCPVCGKLMAFDEVL